LASVRKDLSFAAEKYPDEHWKIMEIPTINGWETKDMESLDGSVWFRVRFQLPKAMLGKRLTIDLGRIRDLDFTYVNGNLVGSMESTTNKRSYTIEPNQVHEGENTLANSSLEFL